MTKPAEAGTATATSGPPAGVARRALTVAGSAGDSGSAVGCFVDTENRDLPLSSIEDPTGMSVAVCLAHCRREGLRYAGVQYAKHCFCGDSYGKYGRAPDAECNMPCTGRATEACGGFWRNSVYEVSP